MALGLTQPLTEMSTRNLPGDKERPAIRMIISAPSLRRLSIKCGIPDLSQLYGPHGLLLG
jgi:hypothetical protein